MHRLEKIANVAVVVTCVLIVANLGRNYLIQRSKPGLQPDIARGHLVSLPGDVPVTSQATLVLALSTNCRFCEESLPFYQKLSSFRNPSGGLNLVAILPEKQETAAAYLKDHGVGVDRVLTIPPTQLGVKATPTLLLLDGQSKLERFWVGKLDQSQESAVLASLNKVCSTCSSVAAAKSN